MSLSRLKIFFEWSLFAFLVVFPFGQLLRFNFEFYGLKVILQPLDLVAGLSIPFFFKYVRPAIFRYISAFSFIAFFSLIFSLSLFEFKDVLVGSLYFLRFFAYTSFFLLSYNLRKAGQKSKIFNSLILVGFFVAIFGWIQYIFYPDLRVLSVWEWDDHLFRLVGTFLDPAFTSIILVFTLLLYLIKVANRVNFRSFLLLTFLLITLALTYSRAGYLAFVVGLFTLATIKKNFKRFLVLIAAFLIFLIFLPRQTGEGVKLERTASIYARLADYMNVLEVAKASPLFGVGFNNLCLARQEFLREVNIESHACAGSDSSLLFVFATTGIVGLLAFLKIFGEVMRSVTGDDFGVGLISVSTSVLAHSFFSNTLFYPWVMGYLAILLSLGLKERS